MSRFFYFRAWIRTMNEGIKNPCVTITPPGSDNYSGRDYLQEFRFNSRETKICQLLCRIRVGWLRLYVIKHVRK